MEDYRHRHRHHRHHHHHRHHLKDHVGHAGVAATQPQTKKKSSSWEWEAHRRLHQLLLQCLQLQRREEAQDLKKRSAEAQHAQQCGCRGTPSEELHERQTKQQHRPEGRRQGSASEP